MKARTGFDAALERARHLLKLYEVLCDRRARAVKKSWSKRFKAFMGWPQRDKIVRVDGTHSLLVLRQATGIQRRHFAHDMLSELLRSSVVAAVSALDRYLHDVVTEHSWKLLRRKEENIPKELKSFRINALDVRKAVDRARKTGSRPGTLVKKSIQRHLHRDLTFQGSNQVDQACRLLGIDSFWPKVAKHMPSHPAPGDLQKTLNQIIRRRNRIVHEADLIVKSKGAKPRVRDITHKDAEEWVTWIQNFVQAVQSVVDAEL